ncbi:MAG TPA: cation:proton antiporter [Gemmataceae bacterium]|nr:cation:proton antiporter [Gemmataceae bacterium]
MHTNLDLILTLTGGLAAALALGYVTHRLGLSPIVGYLLAGIAVGPNTPGFVANRELAEQLAEVGVILLMFGVGLHFHLKELWAVRRIALPGAVVQSLAATVLGAVAAWTFGWGWTAGVVFGLAISVASTVVLTRVLVDHNDLHTPTGHIAVGWLVVEDLFTVVVLVLLPTLFGAKRAEPSGVPLAIGLAALKVGILIALTFLLGGRLIPWLLARVAASQSRELFTLTILVVALGIAVGSAKGFGVSMALGAFLAGMVVGRSDFSLRAASEALPLRDAFAVLFFVSVGMLFDPRYLVEAPGVVAATLGIVVLGKPLAALGIVLLLGYPVRVALAVAVALAQIGEFSFLLANLGRSLGALPDAATNVLVAAAIVSISINPLLYRLVDPAEAWLARRPRLSRWLSRLATSPSSAVDGRTAGRDSNLTSQHRAVIVGYGPVGRTLSRLLRDNAIEPTIIEMNLETVQRLREERVTAVYGDAGQSETLKAAGLDRAASLILSASGLRNAAEIIRLARELNPKVRILVRCAYLRELPALRKAGADGVFAGEGEVALAMIESVLWELGAIPEQIDRERERVRIDLFGGAITPASEPPPGSPVPPGEPEVVAVEEAVREGEPRPGVGGPERGGTSPGPDT